ncbi:hypothetical protein [Enterobacter asburiae]|uniref:hypothetical protein n=1 Tax=Enterobacter asburiae TaxID=61645 RepID=UPI00192BA757|nr:hypothetical protein [Enterobacter asburiae]MBL5924695.1 hypothetical protein [Enterobacter asburiae]MBL5955482.1 hypothetical protein [Enterobacter asburiae]
MRVKKITVIGAAILAIAIAGALIRYERCNKPDYVQDAISRLGSYLGTSYGPTECSSKIIQDKHWQVICIVSGKRQSFAFTVMPAAQAPYSVARSFYLKANDVNSAEVAQLGLMKYLQIDTK